MTVGVSAARRVRRRWAAFAVLLAVSVGLMALSSNPLAIELQKGIAFALSPVQNAVTTVASTVGGAVDTVAQVEALHRRNEALRAENERLAAANASLEAARRDNEELSALLQLKSTLRYRTVAAPIIGRDSSEFRRVLTLGRGTADGIALGDVVIGEVVAPKATGEVVGQLGGALIMQNIDSTERLQIGDRVITAGISLADGVRSPYPRGLVVGSVLDVVRDPNAVVQTAYLQPLIDLDKVTNVLVITDYAGGILDTAPVPSPGATPAATGELPPAASSAP